MGGRHGEAGGRVARAGRQRLGGLCVGGKHVQHLHGLPRVGAARFAGAVRNVGGGDLHVDASAVVGERGLRASLIRGANEQLGRGSGWVC